MPRRRDPYKGHSMIVMLPGDATEYLADEGEFMLVEGIVSGIKWSLNGERFAFYGPGFVLRFNPAFDNDDEELLKDDKDCANEIV